MTDVLIPGDGPAGLATAITLRQHGRTVTIAQRNINTQQVRAGESLSSSALASLQELGLRDAFLQAGHQPCYGNSSCWGNNKLSFFDFIQSPLGPGWYVDRPRFNQMLRDKAVEMGVQFIPSSRADSLIKTNDDTWTYISDTGNTPAQHARLVIDASGRSGWLSRKLGIRRISEDVQIAAITLLTSETPRQSMHSLVEAVEDGWWYVAEVGGKQAVCIFFTDSDLHKRVQLLDMDWLDAKKQQTTFVKYRVPAQRYKYVCLPELTAAGSSYLAEFSGQGWLAAGDAVCSMDPLSSHGISFALRSGIDAARAAHAWLSGSTKESEQYASQLHSAIQIYREQRLSIYGLETRWLGSPYWERRHITIA